MSVNIVSESEDHIDVSIVDGGKQPDVVISDGMWWAKRRRDGNLTIIHVFSRGIDEDEGLEPDDYGYGEVRGFVMGKDYSEPVYDLHCPVNSLMHWYEFICLIEEPSAEFVAKAAKADGAPSHQIQKAPEWYDFSKA